MRSEDVGIGRPRAAIPLVTLSPPSPSPSPTATASATAQAPSLARWHVQWVRDSLLVADGDTATAWQSLTRANVTHVVLCAGNMRPHFSAHFAYRRLAGLYDDGSRRLSEHLPGALLWMNEAQKRGGRVLVCCQTGVSCSAAIVCAYLMWTEGLSFEEALQDLRAAHPQAAPHEGFARQLREGAWLASLPSAASL